MAIRRCPYCKAIIDESDKYCNNCGTQLLFPEDEYVEEDIPGDKIIDEEEGEEEEELEEELREEGGEEEGWEKERGEEEFLEESEEEEEVEELEERREEDIDKKYEVALEDDELIFKTKELKEFTAQAKEEGEGLEEEEQEGEAEGFEGEEGFEEGEGAELEGLEAEEGKEEKVREDIARRGRFPETSQELPPWAREMRRDQLSALAEGEEGEGRTEETEEAGELEEREQQKSEEAQDEARAYTEPTEAATSSSGWTKDSGIGVPERVTRSGLLFGDTGTTREKTSSEPGRREGSAFRREKAETVGGTVETVSAGAQSEEKVISRPSLSLRMKSKLVDLIFIIAIWLISLWFAAQVTQVSFFRMLTKSPLPILGFFFILLLLYFFLFLFFLGETLGDHYFSGED